MVKQIFGSGRIPLQALAVALVIAGARLVLDQTGMPHISVSPLVATVITANVFILGFLLSGVLADYKESERLPGELSISLSVIADECLLLWESKQAAPAREGADRVLELVTSLKHWFWHTERTQALTARISDLGRTFVQLEPFTQANFIVRLKQEQYAILRMVTRVHTIRETSFVSSGYTMARLATALVIIGLLVIKVSPWYESAFLVGVIAWFLTYLIFLINDLDDPFDYTTDGRPRGQEVSLKPILDLEDRLRRDVEAVGAAAVGEAARE